MTELKYEYISCPYCRDEVERIVFSVIDLAEDEDLAEKILKKEINAYPCLNCGREFVMGRALTVLDPHRRLLIVYVPELGETALSALGLERRYEPTSAEAEAWREQAAELENVAQEEGAVGDKLQVFSNRLNRSLPPALSAQDYLARSAWIKEHLKEIKGREPLLSLLAQYTGWECRLTLDYNDLIEKLQIARHDLDDKVIELIKYVGKRSSALQAGNQALERLYFVSMSETALLFLAYDADGWDYSDLPRETYDKTALYKDYFLCNDDLELVDESSAQMWWERICSAGE